MPIEIIFYFLNNSCSLSAAIQTYISSDVLPHASFTQVFLNFCELITLKNILYRVPEPCPLK